jgi:hypothetical protein
MPHAGRRDGPGRGGAGRLRAALAWTAAGRSAVSASYLEVTPPGSATHLTISFRKLVDGGHLDVTAVARAVSLRLSGFGS